MKKLFLVLIGALIFAACMPFSSKGGKKFANTDVSQNEVDGISTQPLQTNGGECSKDSDCSIPGQICDKSGEKSVCIYQVGTTGCTTNSLLYNATCSAAEPSCCDSATCINSKCACSPSDCTASGTYCSSTTGKCETGTLQQAYGEICGTLCTTTCSSHLSYPYGGNYRCGCNNNTDCYGASCDTSTHKCLGTQLGGYKCSDYANDVTHCAAACKSGGSYAPYGRRECQCSTATPIACIDGRTCGVDGMCKPIPGA